VLNYWLLISFIHWARCYRFFVIYRPLDSSSVYENISSHNYMSDIVPCIECNTSIKGLTIVVADLNCADMIRNDCFNNAWANQWLMRRWKSKPGVEFQRGGHLFQQIGSINISTVYWEMSRTFRMQVDLDLPN